MYKLLYPSIRVRTAHPVSVRTLTDTGGAVLTIMLGYRSWSGSGSGLVLVLVLV